MVSEISALLPDPTNRSFIVKIPLTINTDCDVPRADASDDGICRPSWPLRRPTQRELSLAETGF
jgi:hypothetical protein